MQKPTFPSLWKFISEYSVLLIIGAFGAVFWANFNFASYDRIAGMVLVEDFFIGKLYGQTRTLTLHYLINDVLMALFFAIAGKEVWEAVAFPPGLVQDAAKMGALFSFGAVFVSLGVAKVIGVKKIR